MPAGTWRRRPPLPPSPETVVVCPIGEATPETAEEYRRERTVSSPTLPRTRRSDSSHRTSALVSEPLCSMDGSNPMDQERDYELDCPEHPDPVSQAEVHGWSVRNFGELPQTVITLGLAEEVGELCRAVLKREQGVRGTREEWAAEIRKELGDCVIKLLDIAAYEGVDLDDVVRERWAEVSQRNWIVDPQGHGLPDA